MVILTTIYVVAAVLLLFGAAIFVHEWGHYIVARKCGMKVEEFAIGFGKILWKKEKDGILYTVRMIPAGGFVKLPQMLTSEALEGESNEDDEPLPEISPWAKIAVAVAGPIMNIVFAVVLATVIYFVGLPEMITPPVVGNLSKESTEYSLGIREGDIVTKIDDQAIPSWEEAYKLTALSLTNRFAVTFLRDRDEFTHVLTATPISDEIPIKTLDLPSKFPPIVGRVLEGQAASEAGLKQDDKIISLGGIPIGGQGQLIDELQKNGGKATEIVVRRDGENVPLPITPRMIEGNSDDRRAVRTRPAGLHRAPPRPDAVGEHLGSRLAHVADALRAVSPEANWRWRERLERPSRYTRDARCHGKNRLPLGPEFPRSTQREPGHSQHAADSRAGWWAHNHGVHRGHFPPQNTG